MPETRHDSFFKIIEEHAEKLEELTTVSQSLTDAHNEETELELTRKEKSWMDEKVHFLESEKADI
jgi:hypothetical protein